jgi:acyl-CoA reductase-like NAD-dependent aldehyde dehydrogenase
MRTVGGFEGLVLPETTLYAGQEPLEPRDTFADEDPCSGEYFADIPTASPADVDAVVAAARRALSDPSWRNLTPLQRERLLHAFADAIEADLPRLSALEALDTGKPDRVLQGISAIAASQLLGPSADRRSQLGPLISEQHHAKVSGFVRRATQSGIEMLLCSDCIPVRETRC